MDEITLSSPMRKIHKTIKWTIDCFEERLKQAEDFVSPHSIRSPKFVVTGCDGVKYEFGLCVHPNTFSFEYRDFIGVTLTCSRTVTAVFKICFFDKWGKEMFARDGSIRNRKQKRLPWFCKESWIENHPKTSLMVRCDLDLLFPGPEVSFVLGEAVSVEDDWRKKLLAMAEAGQRTDLTLTSNDGARFSCHKLVLASRSSMFNDMIENTEDAMDDGTDAELFFGEMNRDLLAKFLQFVYTGQVDVVGSEKNLYAAAHKYDMAGLLELTGRALSSSLTADNVLGVFDLFDRHNCGKTDFGLTAVKYAAKNIKEVMASEAAAANPDAANRLMQAAVLHLNKFL